MFILYSTKFMICCWSERCMLRPSLWFVTGQNTMLRPNLWFVTGQNTVCYDQVYDLFLVRTLYVTTKFMICYWSVALFTKILTIKNCRKCKTKIKKSFTKILTIILSVKIVLTLRVKLPCPKCKILIVREILVLSFIVSEKNRKKDGRCIGA